MSVWAVQKNMGSTGELWVSAGTFTDYEQARAHAVKLWERDTFVVRIIRVEEGKEPVVMAKYWPTTEESRRT